MNYNNIIIILAVLLVIIVAGGIFFVFNNNHSSNNSPANANNSVNSNISSESHVEQVNTEDAESQSNTNSNTHLVMGEDGYYYTCDDDGNILESVGPSKKYYPDDPSAVDHPEAESYYPYMQHQL